MNYNKGFTLVELLAVIVVLAIILAIAIPSISNIISNTEKSSFVSSTKLLINAVKIKLLEDDNFDITTINKSNLKSILKIEDENYSFVSFRYDSYGKVYINAEGSGKWDNLVTYGNYDNISVTNGIVKNGLVLYLDAGNKTSYPGSGTTWYDLSGNGINGTLVNGVGYNSGYGGSLVFDGVNDYVTLPDSDNWNYSNQDFTIEFWYNFNSVPDSIGQYIYSQRVSGGAYVFVYVDSSQGWVFDSYNSNVQGPKVIASTIHSAQVWKHLAVVRNGNNFRIYINGTLSGSSTSSSSIPNLNAILELGRWTGGPSRYFNGKFSNFRIYKNKGLSQSEVQQNYNALKGRFGL